MHAPAFPRHAHSPGIPASDLQRTSRPRLARPSWDSHTHPTSSSTVRCKRLTSICPSAHTGQARCPSTPMVQRQCWQAHLLSLFSFCEPLVAAARLALIWLPCVCLGTCTHCVCVCRRSMARPPAALMQRRPCSTCWRRPRRAYSREEAQVWRDKGSTITAIQSAKVVPHPAAEA